MISQPAPHGVSVMAELYALNFSRHSNPICSIRFHASRDSELFKFIGASDSTEGAYIIMEFHFDCIFYYVANMDAAIQFYSNTLSLKLISRDYVARFDIDGVLFELVPSSDDRKLRGSGNGRLCLKVDDINHAVDYLRTSGITVGEIRRVENGKIASFEDPDGNEIGLWQYD